MDTYKQNTCLEIKPSQLRKSHEFNFPKVKNKKKYDININNQWLSFKVGALKAMERKTRKLRWDESHGVDVRMGAKRG